MGKQEFGWQTSDNLKIFGQIWQPEKDVRAVIALVHGLGEHCNRYNHLAEFYNQQGIAVISFDLRGHGRSEGQRGHAPSYDAIGDDIQHLLDEAAQRFPDKPIFLYGHSLGGSLVLYFALKRKPAIKGVIATSPGLETAQPVKGAKLVLGRIMNAIYPTFSMPNDLDRSGLSRDPEVAKAYNADPLVHGVISARLGMELLDNGQYVIAHAAEFPLPLLLMDGSADRLVSPAASAAFAAKAPKTTTFKMWEDHYHELHNEPDKQSVFDYELGWIDAQLAVK
ncbi:MAG TPA: lysophospholipase [Longilinea sp.]|nr:lysophospholipase [Longilinea sp.]